MYALSDPARIEIVRCLAHSRRAMTCSELQVGRPKSSMSHHFKILRTAGLIETAIRGTEHYNTLRTAELEQKFPGLVTTLLRIMRRERGAAFAGPVPPAPAAPRRRS